MGNLLLILLHFQVELYQWLIGIPQLWKHTIQGGIGSCVFFRLLQSRSGSLLILLLFFLFLSLPPKHQQKPLMSWLQKRQSTSSSATMSPFSTCHCTRFLSHWRSSPAVIQAWRNQSPAHEDRCGWYWQGGEGHKFKHYLFPPLSSR